MSITFVRAWDNGHSELGAHWIKKGSAGRLCDTLDALMWANHVIQINDDGTVSDGVSGVWAPESSVDLDADGRITSAAEAVMAGGIERSGWHVESGWTGQYGYGGPFMHQSEFIGGSLAEHILSTPGFWVVVYPSVTMEGHGDCADSCEDCADLERGADGWLILHREA